MGCISSREHKSSRHVHKKSEDVKVRNLKKKRGRISRISVAIKVGTGIRKSRVHATSRKIVCIFGKLNFIFPFLNHNLTFHSYLYYLIIPAIKLLYVVHSVDIVAEDEHTLCIILLV